MHAPLGLPETSCQSKENLSLSFGNLEITQSGEKPLKSSLIWELWGREREK